MSQQPDADMVYIGEPLSFKCEMNGSAGWEYFWFKDGNQILANSNLFNILHPSLSDNGTYECKGIRNKTKYESNLSDRRVVFVSGESK